MGSSSAQSQAASRAERFSAAVDGESDDDLHTLLQRLTAADKAVWAEYHLIGDALRSSDLLEFTASEPAFTQRFGARLAAEPHILAPVARRRILRGIAAVRQRALPAVAVAAAAATLTWVLIPQLQNPLGTPVAQLASGGSRGGAAMQQVAAVTHLPVNGVPAPVPGVIRDARLDQYLLAHQQFAPDPVVQGAMPYIRASAVSDGQ